MKVMRQITKQRSQILLAHVFACVMCACAEAGTDNAPPNQPPPRVDASDPIDAGCWDTGSGAVGGSGGISGSGGCGGAGGVGAAGGAAGAGATGGSGGVGATGGTGGQVMCDLPATNPEFFCDPSGDGPCNNCHDCQQIESGDAKTAAKECGTSCGTDRACTTMCVQDRVGASDACTECLADFYDCLVSTCLAECLISADACTQCSRNKTGASGMTCSGQWFACSGTVLNPNF